MIRANKRVRGLKYGRETQEDGLTIFFSFEKYSASPFWYIFAIAPFQYYFFSNTFRQLKQTKNFLLISIHT